MMIDAVTTATHTAWRPRRVIALLAAVLAVAVALFTAGPASAATASAAQTRVGASASTAGVVVGPSANITAGQRLGNDPPRPGIVVATGVAAKSASSGAESAIAGRNLARQLASEQQMGEAGTPLAGAGTATKLRAAERLAGEYGGAAEDWAKMGSSSYRGADGFQFETHWYENLRLDGRFEPKTKFQWVP